MKRSISIPFLILLAPFCFCIATHCCAAETPAQTPGVSEFIRKPLQSAPGYRDLIRLDLKDKPGLLDCFKSAAITNKVRLAWAIAFLGGDDALETLKAPLEFDYQGREVRLEEELAMLEIIRSIGWLGQRSEAAYDYLNSSLSPEVWKQRIKWRRAQENNMAPSEIRFTRYTVMAVGLTGNPRAMAAISSLVREQAKHVRDLAGPVVDSVFYLWFINENGKDKLVRAFLHEEDIDDEFRAFKRSEIGKAWQDWYYQTLGLKKPEPHK